MKQLIAHQYCESEGINHYENLLIRQSYKVPLSRKENKAHKLWVEANKSKLKILKEGFNKKGSEFKL